MSEYGTVKVGDATYDLEGTPDFTGRSLAAHLEDHEEFSALGRDGFGNALVVYWVLPYESGVELDELDFSVADRIEYL